MGAAESHAIAEMSAAAGPAGVRAGVLPPPGARVGAGRQTYGFRPMDRAGAYTGAAAGLDTPRVAPRLIGEEAINDLIRFSLIPKIVPTSSFVG